MVIATCVDDHHIRRQCIHEKAVAGLIITMMIGLDNVNLTADLGSRSLHIPFL
jgi:hypothetical protein